MITKELIPAINVRTENDIDYAEMICTGLKKIETRNSNSLNSYVHKRVRIVKTGIKGKKSLIVGECTLGTPIVYKTEIDFMRDIELHKVSKNSIYWFAGKEKLGYPIINPTLYETPYEPSNRGVVARLNEPYKENKD